MAWIYGLIQWLRNILFDYGILRSQRSPVKTLIIGNLAVGGTGKTPHVIWLASELSKARNIAILSRGYGRKSKGFQWVDPKDDPERVGDEPLEMKTLLPNVPIAVDGKRLRALKRMHSELDPIPDIVILDDGFQHRRLIPDYSIILSNTKRPAYTDKLMPAGRLREPLRSIKRADSVIISNIGSDARIENDEYRKLFRLQARQHLFTSSFKYSEFKALIGAADNMLPYQADAILLVAGIANNSDLLKEVESIAPTYLLNYPDHHKYSKKDADKIVAIFNQMEGEKKVIITTGKDAVKLRLFAEICEIPVFSFNRKIIMEEDQKNKLIESILNHG